ncbi:TPA: hypothetical protein VPF83_000885 [Streptococcus pyogenes]|uniref:Uncharacterized protein n=1 Tax=Streptococcus pyogenes serotype M49 (strain NZ131) TaxID=471876 RepID=A0A0H3BX35_STRPZ|nr:hypothetical protein [Streptococcus pyogenes]ACI60715.1 hypothetical protein Spy49_0379 [Streptococcus pyogenes NZ131]MCX2500493.1 hypothetical protein [Streptococcus pyogenes]MCX2508563.1 hypothetical protein [Streptococcus pyogenes]QXF26273.1 hypothetical protein VB13_02145 [Streptococcus pyogenes]RXS44843.1 hypothetical protein ER615_14190 [Streptococcus pyogenes]
MTLKKHYYLLSLLALVTVGAAFNTSQSVSAQVYSNEGYHQHLTDQKSKLQYSKDNAQLQLRNILNGYQSDLGKHYSSYYYYNLRTVMGLSKEQEIEKHYKKLKDELYRMYNHY